MAALRQLLLLLGQPGLLRALLLEPAAEPPPLRRPIQVLVFGDSWGAWGPSYHMLEDMFRRHGVEANVKSTAVAGTRACQWAVKDDNLADANAFSFPGKGADFIWLTIGGNDLLEPSYKSCSLAARSEAEAAACMAHESRKITVCIDALLGRFYERYPSTKIFQLGYDVQCSSQECLPYERWAYCRYNITCANYLAEMWQSMLLSPQMRKYGPKGYMGIDVIGVSQEAEGIPGARAGRPIFSRSAPCEQMFACVHPRRRSRTAKLIGEILWPYFGQYVIPTMPPMLAERPGVDTLGLGNEMGDLSANETRCNWDWVPSFGETSTPPPCQSYLDSS